MAVAVRGLSKSYNQIPVLVDLNFTIESGEILTFIGPSGAGKTTLLKILTGVETPDAGNVDFSEKTGGDRLLVFQDYQLFPALSVEKNISFGLRARKIPRSSYENKLENFLNTFGLAQHRHKRPHQLSAGQQQRTALARAMILEPGLLLLDEPFANLDPQLKGEMADFIRTRQKQLGITTLCVSHDTREAFSLSDRIGLIQEGRLIQLGSPESFYNAPVSPEVSRFLGKVNQELKGTPYFLPQNIQISSDPLGDWVVEKQTIQGPLIEYTLRQGGQRITAYHLEQVASVGDCVSLKPRQT